MMQFVDDLAMRPGVARSASLGQIAKLAAFLYLSACRADFAMAQQGVAARAPLSLFAYDRSAPLGYEATPLASPDSTLTLHRISFNSPSGGRVTGILTAPAAGGPHAGVIAMHGLPGTAEGAMRAVGRPIAQRGAVVIAIDAPWVRRGGMPELTPRDSTEQVQLMRDLQRAVDVLVARPDVDARRIGYVGGSYGGAMGALFAGIERRLAAAVLFVPDGGLVAHFTTAEGAPTGPLAREPAAVRARWLAAMWPIEPIRFIADAAPTPLLFQNGRTDDLVANDDAASLHEAAREPKTVRWYDAGHGLNAAARAERLEWLTERLQLRK